MGVRIRTGAKDDPDRNPQLAATEKQLECSRGALSVFQTSPSTVRVMAVRGIPGRQAQVAEMNTEEMDVFIAMLVEVRNQMA
jgi:hypothetical protein